MLLQVQSQTRSAEVTAFTGQLRSRMGTALQGGSQEAQGLSVSVLADASAADASPDDGRQSQSASQEVGEATPEEEAIALTPLPVPTDSSIWFERLASAVAHHNSTAAVLNSGS